MLGVEVRGTVLLGLLLGILGLVTGVVLGRDGLAARSSTPLPDERVTTLVIEPGTFIPHDDPDRPARLDP